MPILVGPQHIAGLVTWTVATGVARPHSGISKLKVPTDETSHEFVDLHMLEPFAQELETLPLDTLVFQEPGESLVFYIPLYFEQRMNESLVQRIDTRFRVCKDSRDLVKKFLSALATWADRKPEGPAAGFLARILCHPLLRRLREPDECSRLISPIIGCGTNRRVRQSVADTEAFKTKMARINSSLNQVGLAAEYRPGNEKDKGLRVRRITPLTPSMQPLGMGPADMMVSQSEQQPVMTPIYVGQRRSGNNGQTTKPVTVRTLKPGTTLLTADVGGLQPANPQQMTPEQDLGQPLDEVAGQMVPVSQSHLSTTDDQPAPSFSESHGHLTSTQSIASQQPPMLQSLSEGMESNPGAHQVIQSDPSIGPSILDADPTVSMSVAATLTAAPQQANDMALLPLGQPPHQQPPVTMALADPAMFAPDPLPPRARNVPPRQGGKRRRHRPAATASSASSTVPPADDVLGHSRSMLLPPHQHPHAISYQLPPEQAQLFLQQIQLTGSELDDGLLLNPTLKLLDEVLPVIQGFAAQGSLVKPFVELLVMMHEELSKPLPSDMRIHVLSSLNRQCNIVLSKPLIELCIKVEDQRDYFARIVPTLLGSLATAENELMVAAIVHTTKDSRAESSTLDDCPPHAKRAHHEIPFAQLSLEQLAALIRQQLLRRLPMDPHGPLSSFTAFYQQLQLMRSSGMPASTMAAGVLTSLADFLSPEPAPPTA